MGKIILIAIFCTFLVGIVWLFVEGEMLKNDIKKLQLKIARLEGTQRVYEKRLMRDEVERKTK